MRIAIIITVVINYLTCYFYQWFGTSALPQKHPGRFKKPDAKAVLQTTGTQA